MGFWYICFRGSKVILVSFEAKQALYNADAIFLEITNADADNMTAVFRCKELENNATLDEILDPEIYETVKNCMFFN